MSVLLFRFYTKESHVVVHILLGAELYHVILADKAAPPTELQLSTFNDLTTTLVMFPNHSVYRYHAVTPHHLPEVNKLLTSIHIPSQSCEFLHTIPLKPSGVIYLKFFVTHS